eukprot:gnl/TRDRNA2_/TRDRNA2_176540_c3_seq1.p1 gnl/TRDRNA2_/TRDRNA2_176540_c3~~gnl/TRDRNA2_/TRDRNA2_176540_c3_seq1.p1  ORF type:complete len:130 (+),score=5.62 gnl/TRDRNA2_/TRDRNA2_176540_c3_seq1:217-606(+)
MPHILFLLLKTCNHCSDGITVTPLCQLCPRLDYHTPHISPSSPRRPDPAVKACWSNSYASCARALTAARFSPPPSSLLPLLLLPHLIQLVLFCLLLSSFFISFCFYFWFCFCFSFYRASLKAAPGRRPL